MKKLFPLIMVVVLVMSAFFFSGPANAKENKVIEFSGMVGVPRPYTGATNSIRGIPGGGLPWVISAATGELKANGKLELVVRGLVIDPTDPAAIARGVGGTNPSPNFMAIVSCLSKDAAGNPTTVNVPSVTFPATTSGNGRIETTLSLPSPCIAPIIFVASPGGSWFASTGF